MTESTPQDVAYVQSLVEKSGSSFYWAMRLLPEERRNGMFAVYGFCREVDDVADEPAPLDDKIRRLAAWRDEIESLYAGAPETPVGRVLKPHVARVGLLKEDFLAIIDGMEMDAVEPLRLQTMEELKLYCHRVAVAVGRLSNRVFGIDDEKGDVVAAHLGLALQLTNILRDLKEDAERDRLYLPRELLQRHAIEATEPGEVLAHPHLPKVCMELAVLAEQSYRSAEKALKHCEADRMKPAIVMKEVYHKVLERLRKRGWKRLDERVRLSKAEKMWIGLRHGLL
ncbi:presqualene diphosphate synthase HpnD [Magnetospira sp. QH-2]|uniref:presqualene diphosphate synthase HpnD n=1 Tax=Magnetospira sp. (strain QH-2) TaxID=1288970 RepID=UPI0003E81322|nr:presqualene diphosphate synthase HpnD [Magnetospira sp. QH-2]CCQ73408.1 Putative squalene/phytoene synthase HpnD [Magnetospira sp. QH-2]